MEEHVIMLGRGLVQRGIVVGALCPASETVRPLRQALAAAGVTVHCPAERGDSRRGTTRRLSEVVGTLRRYPGCILHLHLTGYTGGSLVQVAGYLAGARAVLRTEHLPPVPPISTGRRLATRLRDHFLARVICVSQQTRAEHVSQLGRDPRKCVVIPNCVDLERFSPTVSPEPIRRQLALDPQQPVVGTVSRLSETRKGIDHFLTMAGQVAGVYPQAQFLVVGDGTLRPALERQAADLGIAERVIFTGERQDVPRLLAAMDVFVMPSLYEGGPYTVLEAMAMAKPVVSTPVGLVPDAIQSGTSGLLVPPGDPAALATAFLHLLGDPVYAASVGQAGRELVQRRFSLDMMIDGVVDLYRLVA